MCSTLSLLEILLDICQISKGSTLTSSYNLLQRHRTQTCRSIFVSRVFSTLYQKPFFSLLATLVSALNNIRNQQFLLISCKLRLSLTMQLLQGLLLTLNFIKLLRTFAKVNPCNRKLLIIQIQSLCLRLNVFRKSSRLFSLYLRCQISFLSSISSISSCSKVFILGTSQNKLRIRFKQI